MKMFYDCEFHERGPDHPIDLLSIGIVREDGIAYYAVNAEANWGAVLENEWLVANVLPSIPSMPEDRASTQLSRDWWFLDDEDPAVKTRELIAAEVAAFCIPPKAVAKVAGPTEMWGWYADYDHVVLSQLFGRMVDLPEGMPMYTRDLKQEVDLFCERNRHMAGGLQSRIDNVENRGEHNALADALQLRERFFAVRSTLEL